MKEIWGDESVGEILSASAPGLARTGVLGAEGPQDPVTAPSQTPSCRPRRPLAPLTVTNLLISSLNLFMASLYPFVYVPTLFFSLNSSFPSIISPPSPRISASAIISLFKLFGKEKSELFNPWDTAWACGVVARPREKRFVPALRCCPCVRVLGRCCWYPQGKLRHVGGSRGAAG